MEQLLQVAIVSILQYKLVHTLKTESEIDSEAKEDVLKMQKEDTKVESHEPHRLHEMVHYSLALS